MCVSRECRLTQRLACLHFWTMRLEGAHQSFMSSQRERTITHHPPLHHGTLLPLVAMAQTYTLSSQQLFQRSSIMRFYVPINAVQIGNQPINDYTIRKQPLKSHTFQFRNHKASELVTDWKCVWGKEEEEGGRVFELWSGWRRFGVRQLLCGCFSCPLILTSRCISYMICAGRNFSSFN